VNAHVRENVAIRLVEPKKKVENVRNCFVLVHWGQLSFKEAHSIKEPQWWSKLFTEGQWCNLYCPHNTSSSHPLLLHLLHHFAFSMWPLVSYHFYELLWKCAWVSLVLFALHCCSLMLFEHQCASSPQLASMHQNEAITITFNFFFWSNEPNCDVLTGDHTQTSKNRTKITHPGIFSLLLDFVTPYQRVLPPTGNNTGTLAVHVPHTKEEKIAHPVHFFPLLLDFVAPYWLGVLPPWPFSGHRAEFAARGQT
jgi:hypothetical protein